MDKKSVEAGLVGEQDKTPDTDHEQRVEQSSHPVNWTWTRKHIVLAQLAFNAVGPGFTSAIIIPGVESIAEQFHYTPQSATYFVAVHVLFLGLGPFFFTPLMNVYGRRPILLGCMLVSCVAALGAGYSKSYGTLMVARVFQAMGISAGLTLPGAVVVDIFTPEERGRKNGVWTQFVALGPAIGALIGGPLIQKVSWQWSMWLVSIMNGVEFLAYLVSLPETSIAHRRAANLDHFRTSELFRLPRRIHGSLTLKRIAQPLLFLQSPHVVLIAFAYGITFAIVSPGLATIVPLAFGFAYGFGPIGQGLIFISVVIGVVLGELVAGPMSDWLMNRERTLAKKAQRPVRLERRLLLALPGYVLAPVGVVIFGVTLLEKTHWIGPCFGFGIASFGLQLITTPLKTYCVDCYPEHAPAVMQLINATRQTLSFTVPFWSPNLNKAVGYGLGYGIEAIILVVLYVASLLVFWKGAGMRATVKVHGLE